MYLKNLQRYYETLRMVVMITRSLYDLQISCQSQELILESLVSGKTLIDFSLGPIIMHLISVCEFFEEISMLKVNDASIKEFELDGWQEEEEILRGKIKEILKLDLCNDDLMNSLPKFDCVTSIWGLETISKDNEDYIRNLRKLNNLVKIVGYLLFYASINAPYFKIGKDKFHLLPCDENFYRKVISEEGFEIKHYENQEKLMICGVVDHERVVFIVAQKVRKP
ncbi:nicotinamide N-methyltransferase-like [Phyllobates terribilis]|uniref:nicotinamide N-methyltransferase-like n=1 Tax=Phyllobates terribilis TaxID=111132 RepID=UPI003CCAD99C